MRRRVAASAICALLCGGVSAALSPEDEAVQLYLQGKTELAIPALEAASARSPNAMLFLGRAYYEGKGVPQDLRKAAELFAKATSLGDVNAPVWAGLAYEAIGDVPRATEYHRTALQRAKHVTSMLALAAIHRRGEVPAPNLVAATRYQVRAQVLVDAVKSADPKPALLASISCEELVQSVYVEERVADPSGKGRFFDLIPEYQSCSTTGDSSRLTRRLTDAAAKVMSRGQNGVIDEALDVPSVERRGAALRVRFLPGPFAGSVAFSSDSDSDFARASFSGHRFLNDHLGLPIASSVFPTTLPPRDLSGGQSKSGRGDTVASFFSEPGKLNNASVEGLPLYFVLAREWHRGRYDHFHSWHDDSWTTLLRPSRNQLRDGIAISTALLLDRTPKNWIEIGAIIRLYFSEPLPEDARIVLRAEKGRMVVANSAELANWQRKEVDEGTTRDVVVLELPARYPQFAVAPDQSHALSSFRSLEIESGACKAACNVKLEKIEIGTIDRAVALRQLRFFNALNISPYGYTSHGGEGWQVHGDPALLAGYWDKVRKETAATDTTHNPSTFPMANIPGSKGHIEDVLTALGTRAVRPERGPGVHSNDSAHDWDAAPKLFKLYGDKMSFTTTRFANAPAQDRPIDERRGYLQTRLGALAAGPISRCSAANCDLAQAGMLSALTLASLQKAKAATQPFSHVWYTHFGAPTVAFTPTPAEPFNEEARQAFEQLAESHYGFSKSGEPVAKGRIQVLSSTSVLRQRKLEFIVNSGFLPMDRKGDRVQLVRGIDAFLAGEFPRRGHATRDLSGLTFEVDDIFAAEIAFDEPLAIARRRARADRAGDAGEISVVDIETPYSILFPSASGDLGASLGMTRVDPSSGAYQACSKPGTPVKLFNVSHFAVDNPFHADSVSGSLEISISVRSHPQNAFGLPGGVMKRHVFTTDPKSVGATEAVTVHALDLPRGRKSQPRTVYVDLRMPARFLPGPAPSIERLNVSGTIEEVCARVTFDARPSSNKAMAIEGMRFLGSTNKEATSGYVFGGRIAPLAGGASGPFAVQLRRRDAGPVAIATVGEGYFIGKVAEKGLYEVNLIHPACADAPSTQVLVERDTLDLDLDGTACKPNPQR